MGEMLVKEDVRMPLLTCGMGGEAVPCVWVQRWDRLKSYLRSFGSKYEFSKRKANLVLGSAFYSKTPAP